MNKTDSNVFQTSSEIVCCKCYDENAHNSIALGPLCGGGVHRQNTSETEKRTVPSGGFDDRHVQPTVDIHGGLVACHLHNICMENGCLLVGRLQTEAESFS
jgi:hypothetical protein